VPHAAEASPNQAAGPACTNEPSMPALSDNVAGTSYDHPDSGGEDNETAVEVNKDPLLQGHDTTFATETDTQCGYSSPRGVCLLIAAQGQKFCTVHLCPKPGCGRKKSSREPDCGMCQGTTGGDTPNPFATNKENDNPGFGGKRPTLVQQADKIKGELGLDAALSIPDTIAQASTLLGFTAEGDLPSKVAAILALVAPSGMEEAQNNPFANANVGGGYDIINPFETDEEKLIAQRVNEKAAVMNTVRSTRQVWFQHHLTRQTAEAALQASGKLGKFVVRKSSKEGFYSISVATFAQPAFWHGLIRYHPNGAFDMQGMNPWYTLDDLVYSLMTELVPNNKAMPPVLVVI